MSMLPIVSNSSHQELQSFFDHRRSGLQQLAKDLQSGDLTTAQQDYQELITLGQSGPFADGRPFAVARREQDFENIGDALQSGDLAGAKRALLALHQTFVPMNVNRHDVPSPSPSVPAESSSTGHDLTKDLSVIA